MEPSLVVIGINHRTAPLAVRERFWMNPARQSEVLAKLMGIEGTDEVLVLSTCKRTEFILWASDPSIAANSVLNFLTREFGLKLCEWVHFYRLLDEAALQHVFRVAAGLDSIMLGAPDIATQLKNAWELAQQAGGTGRYLDAVMQKALSVADRIRSDTSYGSYLLPVSHAAAELACQIFGTLERRKVLLLGAGKMGELTGRHLQKYGVSDVRVVSRTYADAQELAAKLGGAASPFEERWRHLAEVDIVISCTSSSQAILTRHEAEAVCEKRGDAPLLIVDLAVPRDIASAVREIRGVFLYDVDELEEVAQNNGEARKLAAVEGSRIVASETQEFLRRLKAERVISSLAALRARLEEVCRQELDTFRRDFGPFAAEYDKILEALTSRITQRLASSLTRELKNLPEKTDQERVANVVQRLLQLERPKAEAAVASKR